MSGGGGGHIIIDSTKQTLGNPLVSGQMPTKMQGDIAPILAKDTADWTDLDKTTAGKIYAWALKHCT
jgi:hypothetical protein